MTGHEATGSLCASLPRFVDDSDFVLYVGDARDTLAALPDESVDCCVTSPPYWGLRDYGHEDQIGLEQSPAEYVDALVGVFAEVRRVLKTQGTLWLNLGDSYNVRGPKGQNGHDKSTLTGGGPAYQRDVSRSSPRVATLKPKDLIGIPWRVAFALQADGWWLRSDIIWSKPNPMPESATDRPTRTHEYVFLLSKAERYFYDAAALREKATWDRWGGQTTKKYDGQGTSKAEMVQRRSKQEIGERFDTSTRNGRGVWEIATQPYAEAHFATFPEELAARCIKAGCPESLCRTCGTVRERVADDKNGPAGWFQCGCQTGFEPGVVLDPFMGSGTTALVSRKLGRKAIGVELNPEYAGLCARRLGQQSLLAEDVA